MFRFSIKKGLIPLKTDMLNHSVFIVNFLRTYKKTGLILQILAQHNTEKNMQVSFTLFDCPS